MKHETLHFSRMNPGEIMRFLTEKHYTALQALIDQIGIHLASSTKVNPYERPTLVKIELEYAKLAQLVKNQIRKNMRILFPFIDNVLESGKNSPDALNALEFEIENIHERHMQMRTILANISEMSTHFTPRYNSSESMKVAFSELHSLEQQLYREFYLEDVLLLPKVNELTEQPISKTSRNR